MGDTEKWLEQKVNGFIQKSLDSLISGSLYKIKNSNKFIVDISNSKLGETISILEKETVSMPYMIFINDTSENSQSEKLFTETFMFLKTEEIAIKPFPFGGNKIYLYHLLLKDRVVVARCNSPNDFNFLLNTVSIFCLEQQ